MSRIRFVVAVTATGQLSFVHPCLALAYKQGPFALGLRGKDFGIEVGVRV